MMDANARYKKRWYTGARPAVKVRDIVVPEDVQRFDGVREPCFHCGTRDGCRHRPWMIAS
jgi:hypothetical protein